MLKKFAIVAVSSILCLSCTACFGSEDSAIEYQKTLVDDSNCTFEITGIDPMGFYGYTLKVNLKNKTNTELMFSIDNVSVNDYMCDPFWATTVAAGKNAVTEISWFEDDFEELGIEEVNKIEFVLQVYDYENLDNSFLIDKSFTIITPNNT